MGRPTGSAGPRGHVLGEHGVSYIVSSTALSDKQNWALKPVDCRFVVSEARLLQREHSSPIRSGRCWGEGQKIERLCTPWVSEMARTSKLARLCLSSVLQSKRCYTANLVLGQMFALNRFKKFGCKLQVSLFSASIWFFCFNMRGSCFTSEKHPSARGSCAKGPCRRSGGWSGPRASSRKGWEELGRNRCK